MKNKMIKSIFLWVLLLVPALSASELETPSWIDIEYSNLEDEYVSEYQQVTVTVTEKSMWWKNDVHNVSISYDPNQLELVNTMYFDAKLNSNVEQNPNITTTDDNFKISYQFYLQPDVDITSVPLTITKMTNDETVSEVVNINAYSETTPRTVQVGAISLNYDVTQYTNDGEDITYNIHFEVVNNPKKENMTLTLKENNMSVESVDDYTAKLRFDSGTAVAIDKNNFLLTMNKGDTFDLNIVANIAGLSAKNDRFEFLLYLQDEDENFIRLEPTYFQNELLLPSTNQRVDRYIIIKIAIAIFFATLSLIGFIAWRLSKRKPKE